MDQTIEIFEYSSILYRRWSINCVYWSSF